MGDRYRLVTTLTDHRTDPAATLAALYHERWEVESAFYALRHTLLAGLVLRSRDRFGLEQELWAQLTVYQALRRAMTDAVESAPGIDADRASFTVALEAARDQIAQAEGVLPDEAEGALSAGGIGEAVLAALLPSRRARVSARRVKCAMSRYGNKPNIRDRLPRGAIRSSERGHDAIAVRLPGTPRPERAPCSVPYPRRRPGMLVRWTAEPGSSLI